MATIWKGSLTFGLVNVPVELRTAVKTDHISFRQLHEKDLSPIKYERVSQKTGETVPYSEIVKGYEYAKGKFVVVTDEDFEAAKLEASKTIDIMDFVQESEIDPRHFETPYFLVPAKGGEKAYALLREAMRNGGAVGIGTIILRQSQHLAGVKVVGDALVLELMRFSNELVPLDEYNFPEADVVRPQELKMAEQLVQNLAEPFAPEKYTDEYRENLMKVIKAKRKGKKIAVAEPAEEPEDTKVVDLMARLQASLEGAARGKASGKDKRAGKVVAKPARKASASPKAKAATRSKRSA